jgi:hypothetical protein
MSEGFSLAWNYWKIFKPVRVGAKPSREFKGPYSTSALLLPAVVFMVLLHLMLLILCAAMPHVQIQQSYFIMDGNYITRNQKTTLTLIASLPQEFVTG